jgi:hypothetical protein
MPGMGANGSGIMNDHTSSGIDSETTEMNTESIKALLALPGGTLYAE